MIEQNNEIWNEIIEITKERYQPQQPNELTTIQFSEQNNIPKRTAHDILKKYVKEGKLKVRRYKNHNLYSPV